MPRGNRGVIVAKASLLRNKILYLWEKTEVSVKRILRNLQFIFMNDAEMRRIEENLRW